MEEDRRQMSRKLRWDPNVSSHILTFGCFICCSFSGRLLMDFAISPFTLLFRISNFHTFFNYLIPVIPPFSSFCSLSFWFVFSCLVVIFFCYFSSLMSFRHHLGNDTQAGASARNARSSTSASSWDGEGGTIHAGRSQSTKGNRAESE